MTAASVRTMRTCPGSPGISIGTAPAATTASELSVAEVSGKNSTIVNGCDGVTNERSSRVSALILSSGSNEPIHRAPAIVDASNDAGTAIASALSGTTRSGTAPAARSASSVASVMGASNWMR